MFCKSVNCKSKSKLRGLNTYRKPIVATAIMAMTMGICVGRVEQPIAGSNIPAGIEVLSEQIKDLVRGLEYSDKVAHDFVQMVKGWENEQGIPVLVVWNNKLTEAKETYEQGKISKAQLVETERTAVKKLSQRLRKEIAPDFSRKLFDLADIVKHRQAQCVGYSQLFYVLSNCIDLSSEVIYVQEAASGKPADHVACLVGLEDGTSVMVDLYWFSVNRTNPLHS